MRHHTKDDGDIGVACVIADLTLHGLSVGTFLSEHLPFDLVVVSPTYELCRLSVKFRRAKKGQIVVSLRSMWNDRSGTHIVKHDKTTYDAVAIYCPDTHECYYVRLDEVAGSTVTVRNEPAANNQRSRVRPGWECRDPLRLFGRSSSLVNEGLTEALRGPTVAPASRRRSGQPHARGAPQAKL